MKQENLLFIYNNYVSFVKADHDFLQKNFKVKDYHYYLSRKLFTFAFEFLKELIFLIFNIHKFDIIYCWFADYHSLLPILFGKLFGKRTFLVLGGYDVADLPELSYGSFSNPIRAFCAKNSMKMATLNLAVSDYVRKEALKIDPNINIEVCYNGVNPQNFYPSIVGKENIILTVGNINSKQRIKIKGIDLFCEVAAGMPEYKFVIVGMTEKAKNYLHNIPDNLHISPNIEHNELLQYYQKAKVYCQFSVIESFCIALVEAMLCECIGVVTNVGALPEIIGDCGFVMENRNIESAETMIRKAMKDNLDLRKRGSNRIRENLSFEKREAKLHKLIKFAEIL